MYRKNKIELLSPAGNFDSLKAAIGNGADSIYFGSEYFSARGKATNFTGEEIEKAIDYAHLHSCSIYLALNTLLMDHELDMAKKIAISAFRQGVDAVIVQDIGFARLLNDLIPELPLHASTQASICDKYSVDAWHDLGVKRIILPREFSIEEIKKISVYANDLGIETEVFAHGALCVSYSGQCLMSSMIGSRSGNRGECAQPCRLTYDLVMNNRTIKKSKALISTRDMSAINLTEELKNSNVTALKIEGRMRSAEYVGTATRNFRKAIDNPDSEKIDLTELLLAFNRGGGFTDNYLRGNKGPGIINYGHSGSYGIYIGNVVSRNARIGVVDIKSTQNHSKVPLPDKGDVISVRREDNEKEVASAPLGNVKTDADIIRVKGFHPDVIDKISINDKVYLMEDASLNREAISADKGKTKVEGVLSISGKTLCLEFRVVSGIASGASYRAEKNIDNYLTDDNDYQSISDERCKSQLLKLKSTPFISDNIKIEVNPQIPVSLLNQLRREAVAGLEEKVKKMFKKDIHLPKENPDIESILNSVDIDFPLERRDSENTVSAFFYSWDGDFSSLICDADWYELPVHSFFNDNAFAGLKKLRENQPGCRVAICTPPGASLSNGEKYIEIIKRLAESSLIDGIVSGNPGIDSLAKATGIDLFYDSTANIFNTASANYFMERGGKSVFPSAELNIEDILNMAQNLVKENKGNIQVSGYGKIRLMYTENCPVGEGCIGCSICKNQENGFALRDRKNMKFPIVCHPETCTAEILNSNMLCAPGEVRKIAEICDTRVRLIFTGENITQRKSITECFKKLLSDNSSESEVLQITEKIRKTAEAIALEQGGSLTRGHYRRGAN